MRIRLFLPALIAALVSLSLPAQNTASSIAAQNNSGFLGVWRGQFDNLPGVDLVVTDEGGDLRGAILFYLHKRSNQNAPYTSTPGLPEPIFNIRLEGHTLHFQVSHRRAHPPATLSDPPKDFDLTLTGPDQAELASSSGGAPRLTMKRSNY